MLVAAASLVACARPDPPAESMQRYWDAVLLSDWPTAWSMERAGATGADDPYHYYQRMRAAWPVIDVELGTPAVDGSEAEVTVALTRSMQLLDLSLPKKESVIDRWEWADGRWWHVDTAPVPPPPSPAAANGDELPPADAASAAASESPATPAPADGEQPPMTEAEDAAVQPAADASDSR